MKSDYQKIYSIFSEKFNRVYMHIKGWQKKEIAYLSPTVFGRWNYSALFPETILSPSMIFSSQAENIVADVGFYDVNMKFRHLDDERLEFVFDDEFYSISCHPILCDIDILLDYISPSFMMKNINHLEASDIHKLQRKFSIADKYYVEYIYQLAGRLGLYKRIPSIYDYCIQPTDKSTNEFYLLTNEERLKRIVEESYSICADSLNNEIPFDICTVTSDMIKSYLFNPRSIDDIFIELYGNVEIDLKEMWEKAETEVLSEDDSAVLSTVFYVGICFDRFFINIFGLYLRLIRPIYSFPLNFKEIINALYTSVTINGEKENELFMPCTSYSHTTLGKYFFEGKAGKGYPPIPLEKIYMSLSSVSMLDEMARQSLQEQGENIKIYKFKAFFNNDSQLWKKIEIEGNTALFAAAGYVFVMFMRPVNADFTIKIGSGKKITAQYIASRKNAYYSEIGTTIEDVIPSAGDTIIFGCGDITIRLVYTGEENSCTELIYPRITSQSKKLTDMEREMYLFD